MTENVKWKIQQKDFHNIHEAAHLLDTFIDELGFMPTRTTHANWFNTIEGSSVNYIVSETMIDVLNELDINLNYYYLYIDNVAHIFQDIDNFLKHGVPYIQILAKQYWNSESVLNKIMNSKLLFIPVSKKLSVVVFLYD